MELELGKIKPTSNNNKPSTWSVWQRQMLCIRRSPDCTHSILILINKHRTDNQRYFTNVMLMLQTEISTWSVERCKGISLTSLPASTHASRLVWVSTSTRPTARVGSTKWRQPVDASKANATVLTTVVSIVRVSAPMTCLRNKIEWNLSKRGNIEFNWTTPYVGNNQVSALLGWRLS